MKTKTDGFAGVSGTAVAQNPSANATMYNF
jgi:hypothetical protein